MNYNSELAFAKALALDAGKIMQRYFRAEDIATEFKKDNTPLTVADTTINSLVLKKVAESFPDYGVIGEEESFEPTRDFVWVVDPIDGTMPFSLGVPISTFSLALVDRLDGQPIVAVTYDPFLDNMYTAVKGEGAFLNGKAIKTSEKTDFARNVVAIVGGLRSDEEGYYKPGVASDFIRDHDGRYFSFVSHVYASNLVASGELLAAVLGYGSPWDSAAVCLLVQEAGGIVTDVLGKTRRYDEFAAGCLLSANLVVHEKMLQALQGARP
jgi:myo-inositol-1(or 4)-monophosphatase